LAGALRFFLGAATQQFLFAQAFLSLRQDHQVAMIIWCRDRLGKSGLCSGCLPGKHHERQRRAC